MKQILSDFVNLFYPKPEGESWKWGEIIFVLGVVAFFMFIIVVTLR